MVSISLLNILALVLPLYLIMGLGYGLKRVRFVDGSFAAQLNRLVYYILLPVLLFLLPAGWRRAVCRRWPYGPGFP